MSRSQDRLARSGLYRLLARLWLREADVHLLHQLGSGALGEAFLNAGGVLPALVTGETVEDLAVDYCQLFLGPSQHFPPYQSVWQAGQFEGEASKSVREFAEVVRYDATAAAPGGMVDHLGVQFDLMGHLLAADGDTTEAVIDEMAAVFFAAHLMWPGTLLDAAQTRAQSEFYGSMLALTQSFLDLESQA